MNRLTLSKGELLSWVNSRTKQHGLSANRIDQLGNGAAFLLLLNEMYPGSVRVNKILLSATLDY